MKQSKIDRIIDQYWSLTTDEKLQFHHAVKLLERHAGGDQTDRPAPAPKKKGWPLGKLRGPKKSVDTWVEVEPKGNPFQSPG